MANKSFNLPEGTLSYPHLAEPDTQFDDVGKYKCSIIFDKGTDLSELIKVIKETKGKKPAVIEDLLVEDEDGRITISPRSKFKVGCFDKNKNKLAKDEIADVFYGGAKVIVNVSVYGHNFGVSIGLSNILFVDDGERLGGGGNPFGKAEANGEAEGGFPE